MNNKYEDEEVIDLGEIFYFIKRKLWIIVLISVFFASAGYALSTYVITPMYSATTRVYVLNQSNESAIAYSDLQVSSQFVTDYKELITGRNVTEEVISALNLDMTNEKLSKRIKVTSPTNTRILQITVEDEDPIMAAEIANCVREVASKQIQEITDVDSVRLVFDADIPELPSSPNIIRNTAIGGASGCVAVIVILVIIFLSDCTIRSEDDVERYLSLGVFGSIPFSKKL